MEATNITTISKVDLRKNFIIHGHCCKAYPKPCKIGLHLKKEPIKKGKSRGKSLIYIEGMEADSVLKGWEQSQKRLERSGGCGRSVIH